MKVIIEPQWTFKEALEAAWKAYSGRGQEQCLLADSWLKLDHQQALWLSKCFTKCF